MRGNSLATYLHDEVYRNGRAMIETWPVICL